MYAGRGLTDITFITQFRCRGRFCMYDYLTECPMKQHIIVASSGNPPNKYIDASVHYGTQKPSKVEPVIGFAGLRFFGNRSVFFRNFCSCCCGRLGGCCFHRRCGRFRCRGGYHGLGWHISRVKLANISEASTGRFEKS